MLLSIHKDKNDFISLVKIANDFPKLRMNDWEYSSGLAIVIM